ncbi:MAG TPA: LapA family protein [Acetobacteraceae bacterium]
MRLLIAAPFLLLLVLFALSNPQPARLGLWPTDLTLEAPLSLVVLVGMALAFLAGALMLWGATLAARGRARRAEAHVRRLEAQVEALRAQPSATPILPPPA